MTTDEINKYIHEQIMGKCWHERAESGGKCSKCEMNLYIAPRTPSRFDSGDWVKNPDYCLDTSPRSLLNEVVAKVIPLQRFENRESVALLKGFGHTTPLLLTAEQIARACVEAHKTK